MSEVDTSIRDQLECLKSRCPNLCPAIFPSSFCPKTVDDICSDSAQANRLKALITHKSSSQLSSFSFQTDILYDSRQICISDIKLTDDIDSTLCSLERVMSLLFLGDDDELTVLVERFAIVNGHNNDHIIARRIFYEAYHLAYSLKIMLSNIPGVTITFKGNQVPLDPNLKLGKILADPVVSHQLAPESIAGKVTSQIPSHNVVEECYDNDSDTDDVDFKPSGKKRKRKRTKTT